MPPTPAASQRVRQHARDEARQQLERGDPGSLFEPLPGGWWLARRRIGKIGKRQVQLHGCSPRVAPTRAFGSGERR